MSGVKIGGHPSPADNRRAVRFLIAVYIVAFLVVAVAWHWGL